MAKEKREWQDTDYILALFGTRVQAARTAYRSYVHDGVAMGRRKDLVGGALVRSHSGWSAVRELRWNREYRKGDERILGDGDFVEEVLCQSEEKFFRHCA
jgi:putative transposase